MHIIIFMGRLTADPELSYNSKGTPCVNFSVAVDTGFAENKYTEFYNCGVFGKPAEALKSYLVKGDPIIVHGQGKTETWEDKLTKQPRKAFKIRVNSWEFVLKPSKKNEGAYPQPGTRFESGEEQPETQVSQPSQPPEEKPARPQRPPAEQSTKDADDIPF